MTISIEVQYDNNPQGIFYAGQTLSGSAVLKLTESDTVNGKQFGSRVDLDLRCDVMNDVATDVELSETQGL